MFQRQTDLYQTYIANLQKLARNPSICIIITLILYNGTLHNNKHSEIYVLYSRGDAKLH